MMFFLLECWFIGKLALSHFTSASIERMLNENTPNKFKQKIKIFQIIWISKTNFPLLFQYLDFELIFWIFRFAIFLINQLWFFSPSIFLLFYLFNTILVTLFIWCWYCVYMVFICSNSTPGNTRMLRDIRSMLTIKSSERRQLCCSGVLIINFSVFPLLTLNK